MSARMRVGHARLADVLHLMHHHASLLTGLLLPLLHVLLLWHAVNARWCQRHTGCDILLLLLHVLTRIGASRGRHWRLVHANRGGRRANNGS